jgi:hypothetical protein
MMYNIHDSQVKFSSPRVLTTLELIMYASKWFHQFILNS